METIAFERRAGNYRITVVWDDETGIHSVLAQPFKYIDRTLAEHTLAEGMPDGKISWLRENLSYEAAASLVDQWSDQLAGSD